MGYEMLSREQVDAACGPLHEYGTSWSTVVDIAVTLRCSHIAALNRLEAANARIAALAAEQRPLHYAYAHLCEEFIDTTGREPDGNTTPEYWTKLDNRT